MCIRDRLYGGQAAVFTQLDLAIKHLETAAEYDPSLGEMLESLRSLYYIIEDHVRTLSAYNDRIDFDPLHKEQLDERQYTLAVSYTHLHLVPLRLRGGGRRQSAGLRRCLRSGNDSYIFADS